MSPITIGLLILLIGVLSSIYKFFYNGYSFIKYIKEKYPQKWEEMVHKDWIVKALLPFGKDTATYFIYKSKDTYGDEQIAKFRKSIRRHTLFLVIVYPISFLSYIIIVIWLLETFV